MTIDEASDLDYLTLGTKLLQRVRLADPEAGLGKQLICSGSGTHLGVRVLTGG